MLAEESVAGLPDTARLSLIVLMAKGSFVSCKTAIRARELGRWIGMSRSTVAHDVLPAFRKSDAARYRVTAAESGQTTGLEFVVMAVWRARRSGDVSHPLALSKRELVTLLRLIEALFAPGWGPDGTSAGMLAAHTGPGAATDRLALLLLVLQARPDGRVRLVGGTVPKGRGRPAATVAQLLGCSVSGGGKVLGRIKKLGRAETPRVKTASLLRGKSLLVVPAVAAAHSGADASAGPQEDRSSDCGVVCENCAQLVEREEEVAKEDAGAGEYLGSRQEAASGGEDGGVERPGTALGDLEEDGQVVVLGNTEGEGTVAEARTVVSERPADGPLHALHPRTSTVVLKGAGSIRFSGEAAGGSCGRPDRACAHEDAPLVLELVVGPARGSGDGGPLRGEKHASSCLDVFLPAADGVRDACREGLDAWTEATGGPPPVWAPVPKGWEELLAPVAMVWGRLDRLAARATVRTAVHREIRCLDGLFGPGRGMVLLGSRLRRRAAEQGRRPIADPVGWLVGWAIPRRAVCPDARCDDGRRMDTGASCERCAERHRDLVARRRAVGMELALLLGAKAPAGEYRRMYEARLQEVTRQAEEDQAARREKAAVESAQRQEALAAHRAEQELLEEREQARPCAVCGRARSGGLCEICGHGCAAETAFTEAVALGLAARGRLAAATAWVGEAEYTAWLEGEIRALVDQEVNQAVAEGATELTAAVLRKLAAERQRSVIREEALRLFATGAEARGEAEGVYAARMRRWHLHPCDGQHDCDAFVREDAERVAEQARWRVAENLLEQRLALVQAQRAVPVVVEPDAYALGAARARAAMCPRAGVSA
ncbi:hypothetical protein [Streptomyces aureoversilis]|uniref:Uncharacterized protein n=1 Tax=Streptomyces aureoversilis TaxID=67277 RepID=A0ABW0A5V0_9ACTN